MAKLGEICAFQSGGTPSKNKPEYFGGEIPWISTTALNGGKINETDAVAWITPKAIRESAAKIVPANSIMIGTRVGIGKVAINTVEMSTSQDVISLINIDEDKWYKPYLCKLLLSKKDYFNSQARGATIKGIKIDIVANIDVPEIDYATQRKIAETLSKVDELIAFREQQLAKLDELVKARFVEMFGDPIRNEKGWNTYTLAEMCDGIGDGLHGTPEYDENGEYPFINGNNLISGIIQINPSTKKVNKKTYEKHYIKISQNAILLSINGTLGRIAFYNSEQVMLGKSACYCNLRDEVNRIFVYNIMKTNAFARYLEDNATKSTIKNVGLKAIREYRLIMPPIPLQNQFSSFVERVDQQKQTVQQSLEKLELMKKALMQEYFG